MHKHQELAAGRWFTMTLAEQLGNIGSEYGRATSWAKKDAGRFNSALARYLELLDLTINDPRWGISRKKEFLRLREATCEELINKGPDKNFQKYFDQFALLARKNR
mgnify:CR=1 FL=1